MCIRDREERGFELLQGSEIFQGGLLGGCLESLYDVLTNSRYEDEKMCIRDRFMVVQRQK